MNSSQCRAMLCYAGYSLESAYSKASKCLSLH